MYVVTWPFGNVRKIELFQAYSVDIVKFNSIILLKIVNNTQYLVKFNIHVKWLFRLVFDFCVPSQK